ncbi:MAG: hypothetical protein KC561_18775, partial [Myxococcales bacterium]|nr:hypothetical protein [Myxococcales bacterium]
MKAEKERSQPSKLAKNASPSKGDVRNPSSARAQASELQGVAGSAPGSRRNGKHTAPNWDSVLLGQITNNSDGTATVAYTEPGTGAPATLTLKGKPSDVSDQALSALQRVASRNGVVPIVALRIRGTGGRTRVMWTDPNGARRSAFVKPTDSAKTIRTTVIGHVRTQRQVEGDRARSAQPVGRSKETPKVKLPPSPTNSFGKLPTSEKERSKKGTVRPNNNGRPSAKDDKSQGPRVNRAPKTAKHGKDSAPTPLKTASSQQVGQHGSGRKGTDPKGQGPAPPKSKEPGRIRSSKWGTLDAALIAPSVIVGGKRVRLPEAEPPASNKPKPVDAKFE